MATRSSLRSRRLSIGSLLVVRLLLIANALTLVAIGGLYLAFGARPAGYVAGGLLIAAGVALLGCVPLTDPYRAERRRREDRAPKR